MSSPLDYAPTTFASLTGNAQIDSMIFGTRWMTPDFYGEDFLATRLTYSFVVPGQSYFARGYSPDNEFLNSFELTAGQKSAVTTALNAWSAVANVKFTLVDDNLQSAGDLRFGGYAGMDPKTAAWAYFPDNKPLAGDVWIGPVTDNPNPGKGTYDYMTFIHEIGHALGLKHPFEASPTNSNVIAPQLNDSHFTLMSYNNSYSFQPTTPMLLDILAIQKIYGANTHWQTGNNVYKWAPDQSVFETIWDAGGSDTIDGSNQLAAVHIDLHEGAYSQIGKAFVDLKNLTNINDGLAIAYGAKIENAVGSAFDDVLVGNDLDNILKGNAGADIMDGGSGNDTYYVDNVADTIIENGTSTSEIDTVYSSIDYTLGANLEYLFLEGGANLNGTGNALNNKLVGNAGSNILDGGAGIDVLIGGAGNDTYVVDNVNDIIVESSTLASEIDTVRSSVNWTLGDNLENLVLTGNANINATGNAQNNVLTGNAGDNLLFGGAGLDTMIGGAGNDTYNLDQAGELALVQELANEGRDIIHIAYNSTPSTETVDLSASNLRNIENLFLAGSGQFTVIGNDLNNTLVGNSSANTLQGGAGDDLIDGGAGADNLIGGIGNDTYVIDNTGDKVIEAVGEGHDLVRTSINYTLTANVEDGVLLNQAFYLAGNDLDNKLVGNALDNILIGGAGADIMDGGSGNDTYYVDNVADTIIENGTSTSEIDTVYSSIDYTLGANLEYLFLEGGANLNGTGNALNNKLVGNAGSNILDGGAGIDVLIGGAGNDTYVVDNVNDIIVESSTLASEIDTVRSSVNWTLGDNLENLVLTGNANINATGNAQNNVLTGNAGDNLLFGGAGLDTMIGGAGNDTYNLDQAGELALVQELANEGRDIIHIAYNSTPSTETVDLSASNLRNIENLFLAGSGQFTVIGNDLNNTLVGNSSANTLQGGAGDDLIDGGAGADNLIGGIGNDTYVIDNTGDKVIEAVGEGHDLVRTSINYTLTANVEDGVLLNQAFYLAGNDLDNKLVGNTLDNILIGGAGNDLLDGGTGADSLTGGTGDDTYIVENTGDKVVELANEGHDLVRTAINYTLTANVEDGQLLEGQAFYLAGNDLDNILTGNSGNNSLYGGAGNDTLIGGTGTDTLYGGTGADTFVFNAFNETGKGNARDIIADFNSLQGDKIDLTKFDANLLDAGFNGFSFIGAADFTGAGQLRFVDHVLSGNVSGNAGADFEIQLVGVNSFSANDLVA